MAEIIKFNDCKDARAANGKSLQEKMKTCKWEELDDDDKFFAAAFYCGLKISANKIMNADIIRGLCEEGYLDDHE